MISQELLRSILNYDSASGNFYWIVGHARRKAGDVAGSLFKCKKGKPYTVIGIKGKLYYAHRLAFLWVSGKLPEKHVDHIDGNGLNNSWDNLREASRTDNAMNVKLKRNNTSGYCGVYFSEKSKKWVAQVGFDKKVTYLGSFERIEDAVAAREDASKRHGFHKNHGSIREL